ncbi:MAG: ABC transporter permease [Coriobacteriales bacterium]|jgi:ABC-type antimicrobial peptide transport system permease subunit|nr:ABC transporter permease [Coriobacteriales bacterium]
MRLLAKLAFNQIKANRSQSAFAVVAIALCTALLTAMFGVIQSFYVGMQNAYLSAEHTLEGFSEAIGPALATVEGLMSVFIIIVIIAAIMVNMNAIRISAAERTQQFGILKSVGATKRQLRNAVVLQAMMYCIVGIPVGILVGFGFQLVALVVLSGFMSTINAFDSGNAINMPFAVSGVGLVLTIALALATTLLASWRPAARAAKVPAISSIKQSDDYKVKPKNVRTLGLYGKLFGFEGNLAAKTMRRNHKKFRVTVAMLAVSTVMFIATFSFAQYLQMGLSTYAPTSGSANDAAAMAITGSLFQTVQILLYCFIVVVAIVAAVSAIATISTNIRTRVREFAVLQSVGMTYGGLKKMLRVESLIYATKALIIGLIVGALVSWLEFIALYGASAQSSAIGISYVFPWQATLICIIAIFALAFATTAYSRRSLAKNNIIQTIRAESI